MATLQITPRIMSIGGRMIQISNIAEAGLWQDLSGRGRAKKLFIIGFILFLISLFYASDQVVKSDSTAVWIFLIGVVLIIIGFISLSKQKYELILQTNAGKITPLSSTNKKLLDNILMQLQIAISHENPTQNYSVTIADNIVNSVISSSVGGNIELKHNR